MKFKELKKLDQVVAKLYRLDPNLKQTKFGYAYKRFYEKNYQPTAIEFNDALNTLWIDNALEGEKNEILIDKDNSRGFKFSKDGLKNVIAQEKKLIEKFDEKEIEIVPFIPSYIPPLEALDEEELALLDNFIKDAI